MAPAFYFDRNACLLCLLGATSRITSRIACRITSWITSRIACWITSWITCYYPLLLPPASPSCRHSCRHSCWHSCYYHLLLYRPGPQTEGRLLLRQLRLPLASTSKQVAHTNLPTTLQLLLTYIYPSSYILKFHSKISYY